MAPTTAVNNKKKGGNSRSLLATIMLMLSMVAIPTAVHALSIPALSEQGSGLEERQTTQSRARTFANPIDLPYRFQPDSKAAWRECADPMVIYHKGEYWMFASHSLGYWHSTDLTSWSFTAASGYAVEKFAPTTVEIDGKLYLATSEGVNKIWTTDDVASGQWKVAADNLPWGYQDPALFLDDTNRLFYYDGLSPDGPLYAVELNRTSFQPLNVTQIKNNRDKTNRGWEVPGDNNQNVNDASYIEGSWMTKRNGKYYLEYSGPGTQYKSYANGMLTSNSPLGPWKYETYSPFAHKSTGFIAGAGHGATFLGPNSQYWHVGTMSISVLHWFERRLGLFPTHFTSNGEMVADTYLGDYPRYYDGDRSLTGWMVLSRKKKATSSSSQNSSPSMAADEEVRTWWTAATGNAGEWLQIDLDATKTIQAFQVNFADQDAKTVNQITASNGVFKYVIETSNDGTTWSTAVAETSTGRDAPHAYHVLSSSVNARYVRITNKATIPNSAKFSLYDLRVFGNANVSLPAQVTSGTAKRSTTDGRKVTISWPAASGAQFYVVRLGPSSDLYTQNFQVYDGATSVDINTLNVGTSYSFTVDAINEAGITKGTFTGTFN
ncbi:Arabinanase/levansucrase/invertase [Testicularia cyperi]|uniref:Arabinanase/levansucrase/invertase n=1 Tax=Testicularia cyperi TaxID=1882483 RepID=A0A317XLA3_9BASI|nr:Arabinanase/levansucrase/invertase [Testicularia cyperi]